MYIQSRFNKNNNDRILVTDTNNFNFKEGRNIINHIFKVPYFNDKLVDYNSVEGLSVAFRLFNNENKLNEIIIHSIKLKIIE